MISLHEATRGSVFLVSYKQDGPGIVKMRLRKTRKSSRSFLVPFFQTARQALLPVISHRALSADTSGERTLFLFS